MIAIGTRRRREISSHERAVALQAASLLLAYPDEALLERLPLLLEATGALAASAAEPLQRFVAHLQQARLEELEADYVDTFDLRRRCCLYLTYFSHGDTRKRGMALLRFSHAYRQAGVELSGDELPDHLAVVCEFAATGDAQRGLGLLTDNRPALELLRRALAEVRSPYVDLVEAICAVLPPAAQADLDKALELARTGPPEEEVGLEPYGPPESMGGRR